MDETDADGGSGLVAALPAILWQRRWWVIIPAVLAAIVGVTLCLVIPRVYSSEATVLIESQDLPGALGDTPVSDMVDQRIARAKERVLSRQELIRLIRAYSLYESEQRRMPFSKIVDKMRDDTSISAVAGSGEMQRRGAGTIALLIGFQYSDPVKAQTIAQQYVNRFLEVDATTQIDQATGAANFLQDQANTLRAKVAGIERQIAQIKSENGVLLALGQQSTGSVTGDAARIDMDIVRIEADSAMISAGSGGGASRDIAGVGALENQLRVLQARYSDTYPDVVAVRAQLDAARRAAASVPAEADPNVARLAANRTQLNALRSAKAMLLSQSGTAQAAQARAPAINARIEELSKEAEGYRTQFEQISSRLQGAQMAAKMETDQKGERLTLADPPVVPDSPTSPNRPVIMITAIACGLAFGVGIVMLVELLFRPLRGPTSVKWVFGQAPLAVIADLNDKPSFITRFLERRNRRRMARA